MQIASMGPSGFVEARPEVERIEEAKTRALTLVRPVADHEASAETSKGLDEETKAGLARLANLLRDGKRKNGQRKGEEAPAGEYDGDRAERRLVAGEAEAAEPEISTPGSVRPTHTRLIGRVVHIRRATVKRAFENMTWTKAAGKELSLKGMNYRKTA